MSQIWVFAVIFGGTFCAAAIGSMASIQARDFYKELRKPKWAPSGAVFGPVWTVLYVLMAISANMVVSKAGWSASVVPLLLFIAQLTLNSLWTWIFFAWRSGKWSLLDIVLLWGVLASNIVAFYVIIPVAGILLIPYLLWISFATVLNASVNRLNPALLG